MNLLKYTSSNELKISGNSDVLIDALKIGIVDKLHEMKISTELSDDSITFKRFVIIMGTHDEENKRHPMKIFREGNFRIRKSSSNKIEIYSEFGLDYLLVLSVMVGIMGGLFIVLALGISTIVILSSVISGFALSVAVYLFGLFSILTTLNEILETSLAKTTDRFELSN
jgi:hypothetical protein